MLGKRTTPLLIALVSFLLVAVELAPLPRSDIPGAVAESQFGFGAVVGLQGTPHLWIADEAGVLHWGGDTRALRSRFVDWSARVDVSLDTLRTLTRGDPYLTAGLLKDGEPIYLVKWETEETVPRLFHIQCIPDVELFGIKTENYLNFVIDRPDWESRTWEGMRLQASNLQKLELPGAAVCPNRTGTATPTPGATATPVPTRPEIHMSPSDVASCPWQRYGLMPSDANLNETVSIGLPPSVSTGVSQPIFQQIAPLARPPSSGAELLTGSQTTAIGVVKLGRGISVGGASLPADSYIVAVRPGATADQARTIFAACANGAEMPTSVQPQLRTLVSQNVSPPQVLATTTGTTSVICYSWNRVQVCTQPGPSDVAAAEQGAMNSVMSQSIGSLVAAGRLQRSSDVNELGTLPDIEGMDAVRTSRGGILAAPATSWPGTSANNAVAGVIHAELEIVVPGTPRIPPGEYVVRVSGSNMTGWVAQLIALDGSLYQVPVVARELLGGTIGSPQVAIANLAFILSRDVQLCFFGEC
jgi:hypothetical protein